MSTMIFKIHFLTQKQRCFMPNIIKQVVKYRKMDADQLSEKVVLLDFYKNAVDLE